MDSKIDQRRVTVIRADGTKTVEDRFLLVEHPLTVIVNERPVYRLICIRDHIRELVVGRLYTDRLISSLHDIRKLYICHEEYEARVFLKYDVEWESALSLRPEASCCTSNYLFKKEWIFKLAGSFTEGTPFHQLTQGNHSCLLSVKGEIVFSCEDIGRHNAVDKAVGYALYHDIMLSDCMLYISGRVPVDMVEKVIAAGIPVLVTKAVATAESAALARKKGLILICRAYQDQFEIM